MGYEKHMPTLVLIACQFLYSGVTLTGRAALLQDMNPRVFVAYRQCTAFLITAPIAFFKRRESKMCCLGWRNFWLIFLLSFVGVTANQNMYFEGLSLASSAAASALDNLVPAITFIIAYTMGLEKVYLWSLRSVAKIIGTVFCVSGAVTMALLKGSKLLDMEFISKNSLLYGGRQNEWLIGCLFLFGRSCCWSLWLILQAHVSASYPDHLSLTAWMCLMAALQCGVLTSILQPNMEVWKMNSSLQIFCCLFAGSSSAITYFAQAWCISRRGPLFSATFNPLGTVIVTMFACIFMHEELYIGSLAGAVAVIVGLYIVLWGKSKDLEEIKDAETSPVKEPNDQTFCAESSDSLNYKIDLEQPLLSEKQRIN